MSKKKHFQLFTTCQGLLRGTWFPMDHIFWAPYDWDANSGTLVEKDEVVWLEGHADMQNPRMPL